MGNPFDKIVMRGAARHAHHFVLLRRSPENVKELEKRGVEFAGGIAERGDALVTHFKMPGEGEVHLSEPRYRKRRKPRGA